MSTISALGLSVNALLRDPDAAQTSQDVEKTKTAQGVVQPEPRSSTAEPRRGASAIALGLRPPRNSGASEADIEAVRQFLDAIRNVIDDNRSEASTQRRLGILAEIGSIAQSAASSQARQFLLEFYEVPDAKGRRDLAFTDYDQKQKTVQSLESEKNQKADWIAGTYPSEKSRLEAIRDHKDTTDVQKQQAVADLQTLDGVRAAYQTRLGEIDAALPEARALRDAAETVYKAADAHLQALQGELQTLRDGFAALAASLALALAKNVADGEQSGVSIEAATLRDAGEDARTILIEIVEKAAASLQDEAQIRDAVETIVKDLDRIQISKVGLAFSAIHTSLLNALTAMAEGAEQLAGPGREVANDPSRRARFYIGGAA